MQRWSVVDKEAEQLQIIAGSWILPPRRL